MLRGGKFPACQACTALKRSVADPRGRIPQKWDWRERNARSMS